MASQCQVHRCGRNVPGVKELSRPRLQRQPECHQPKGLMSSTCSSSATPANSLYFYLELNAGIPALHIKLEQLLRPIGALTCNRSR